MATKLLRFLPSLFALYHVADCIMDDFRLGIQVEDDGGRGNNAGSWRYTGYVQDGTSWSSWAGDNDCYDPDAVRLTLQGRDNPSYSSQYIENIDIRFWIQVEDNRCSGSGSAGTAVATNWVSQGASWSAWSNDGDWDGIRVAIETRSSPGLIISWIQVGLQLRDYNGDGTARYTSAISASNPSATTPWTGDPDYYDSDGARIYINGNAYTRNPTRAPIAAPTANPTPAPTLQPTAAPTNNPTSVPTENPTNDPTIDPTADPTAGPTSDPTMDPTQDPTFDPTRDPTSDPTVDPTTEPTVEPTKDPTFEPTINPSTDPTLEPTMNPTLSPSYSPTKNPTLSPSFSPTLNPTNVPTKDAVVNDDVKTTENSINEEIDDEKPLQNNDGFMENDLLYILFASVGMFVGCCFVIIGIVIYQKLKKKQFEKNADQTEHGLDMEQPGIATHTAVKSNTMDNGEGNVELVTSPPKVKDIFMLSSGDESDGFYDNVTTQGNDSDISSDSDVVPVIPQVAVSPGGDVDVAMDTKNTKNTKDDDLDENDDELNEMLYKPAKTNK